LYEYNNFFIPTYNKFISLIKLCQRGNAYVEMDCIYDKDNYPVFHFNNPLQTITFLFKVPLNKKVIVAACFKKEIKILEIYDKKNQKYTFFALGKPTNLKGFYFS
jgi:hypothetical protein